jgi:hypothetical protein
VLCRELSPSIHSFIVLRGGGWKSRTRCQLPRIRWPPSRVSQNQPDALIRARNVSACQPLLLEAHIMRHAAPADQGRRRKGGRTASHPHETVFVFVFFFLIVVVVVVVVLDKRPPRRTTLGGGPDSEMPDQENRYAWDLDGLE